MLRRQKAIKRKRKQRCVVKKQWNENVNNVASSTGQVAYIVGQQTCPGKIVQGRPRLDKLGQRGGSARTECGVRGEGVVKRAKMMKTIPSFEDNIGNFSLFYVTDT